ncbi:MAG: TetR/AcrR family transcriptional regulator [Steroidobacteraceae bacterium]
MVVELDTPRTRAGDHERIVTEATRLFAARGLFGASLREVARQCRVPLSTLNTHFPKKRDLQAAVIDSAINAIAGRIVPALSGGGTPEQRLRRYIEVTVQQLLSNDAQVRVLEDAYKSLERADVAELTKGFVTNQRLVRAAQAEVIKSLNPNLSVISLERMVDVTFSIIYGLVTLHPVHERFAGADVPVADVIVEEATFLFSRILGVSLTE